MWETGLFQHWVSWSKRHAQHLSRLGLSIQREEGFTEELFTQWEVEQALSRWKARLGNRKLTLEHLEGGFYVLFCGLGVSSLAWALEHAFK